jgi:hypothetical protein
MLKHTGFLALEQLCELLECVSTHFFQYQPEIYFKAAGAE